MAMCSSHRMTAHPSSHHTARSEKQRSRRRALLEANVGDVAGMSRALRVHNYGKHLVSYREGLKLQQEAVDAVKQSGGPDVLFQLEVGDQNTTDGTCLTLRFLLGGP